MSTISAQLIILAAFVVLTLARVQPLVSNSSHTFPRLANCWGAGERLVTAEQWRYLGFSVSELYSLLQNIDVVHNFQALTATLPPRLKTIDVDCDHCALNNCNTIACAHSVLGAGG